MHYNQQNDTIMLKNVSKICKTKVSDLKNMLHKINYVHRKDCPRSSNKRCTLT